MKNYVSINFIYLRDTIRSSQSDFATIFNTTKEIIGAYENNKKKFVDLTLFQSICEYFKITLDDFVNVDLSKKKDKNHYVSESEPIYEIKNSIELYERMLKGKDEIIVEKERIIDSKDEQIAILEKSRNMLEVIINQNNKN